MNWLRGESLFKAELSDLCSVIVDSEKEFEQMILVLRIAVGKTNGTRTLYGRVMRHKDVYVCPIGALALYLFSRFHLAGEKLDFGSNSSWFDAKLLIECGSKTPNVSVRDSNYANSVKNACKELDIISKHFIHFGRSVGLVTGEFQELDQEKLRNIGNWNIDCMNESYSSKMPLRALRGMAGHSQEKV
jgi:hypothetical protein